LSSRNSVFLQKPIKKGSKPLSFEVVPRVPFRAVLCPHFWEPIIDLGMDYRIWGVTRPGMVQFRVPFWGSISGYVRNPLIWGKSGNGCFGSPTNKVSFSSKNSVFQMKPIKTVSEYGHFGLISGCLFRVRLCATFWSHLDHLGVDYLVWAIQQGLDQI